ncbi:MAG: hypothetical protein IPF57_02455 [Gammaproteobacteria bacterium]|jgi:hypothetical protein|nr:hypothetical protein [Gammaproteobacteria bacterium]MBK8990897.1 hypothetical protein [Gammaproteobacteria bacterium]MBK9466552.1 hypothetical protein [Gammaproteobacteria bacterium]MBP7909179.1 hypothetical protein [Pseudomonadales bacterium]
MKAHVTRAEGRCCIGCGQAFNSTRKVADWQTVREYPRAEGAKAITTGPVCAGCALAKRGAAAVSEKASRSQIRHHHLVVELAEGVAVEFTAPAIRPGDALALMCEWVPAIPAHITPALREQYREARDTFIQHVRAASGPAPTLIVEPNIGHPAV